MGHNILVYVLFTRKFLFYIHEFLFVYLCKGFENIIFLNICKSGTNLISSELGIQYTLHKFILSFVVSKINRKSKNKHTRFGKCHFLRGHFFILLTA